MTEGDPGTPAAVCCQSEEEALAWQAKRKEGRNPGLFRHWEPLCNPILMPVLPPDFLSCGINHLTV